MDEQDTSTAAFQGSPQVRLQEASSSFQQPASPQCVILGLSSQDAYRPLQAGPGSPAGERERQTALPRTSALSQPRREVLAAGPATTEQSSASRMLQALLCPQGAGSGPGPGQGLGLMPRGSRLAEALGRAADPFAVIEASAILLCASELQEELAAFMPEASGAQRLLPPVCTLPASHPDAPPQDSQRPCTPAGSPGLPGCEAPGSSAAPSAQQSSEVQGLLLRDFVDLFGSPDCQQPDNPPAASLGRGDSELGRAAAAVAGPQAAQGSAAPAGAALGCKQPVTWEALEAQTQELLRASVGHSAATSPAFVCCAGGATRTRTAHSGAGAADATAAASPHNCLPGCRAQGGAGVSATSLRPEDSPTVGLAALRIRASPGSTPHAARVRRRPSPGPGQQHSLGTSPIPAGASARGRARRRPATLGDFEVPDSGGRGSACKRRASPDSDSAGWDQAALRATAPCWPGSVPGSARKQRATTASGFGPGPGPYTAPPAPRPPAACLKGSGAGGQPAGTPKRRVRRALPFSVPASPAASASPAQGPGPGFVGLEACSGAAPALPGQSGAVGSAGCRAEDCIARAAKLGDLPGDPAPTLSRSPGRTKAQSCTKGMLLTASCAPAADPSQDLQQALPADLLCIERLCGGSGDGALCSDAAGARDGLCGESATSGAGASGSQENLNLDLGDSSPAHGTPPARNRTGRPRSGGRAPHLTRKEEFAGRILGILSKAPGTPERAIRAYLGDKADTSKVLRQLVRTGVLLRSGSGGRRDPFAYQVADVEVPLDLSGVLARACAAGECVPTGLRLSLGHGPLAAAVDDLFGRPRMVSSATRSTPAPSACASAESWRTWPENTQPASDSNASPGDVTASSPHLMGGAVGVTGTALLGLAGVQLPPRATPRSTGGNQASVAASGHTVGDVEAAYRPEDAGSAPQAGTVLLGASPLTSALRGLHTK